MAKFTPIKKHGTGLERWKDEKTGKEWRKNGITHLKKDWKEWKDPFQEREKTKKTWKEKDLFKMGTCFFLFLFQQIWASTHFYTRPGNVTKDASSSLGRGLHS